MNSNDPRIVNVSIISANLEATYKFSSKISHIQIQARGNNSLQFSHTKGQAVSGTYQTIKPGGVYSEVNINAKPNYYFVGAQGDVVELLFWY